MDKIWKCVSHGRATEIYCETCKIYLCVECLAAHSVSCPSSKYVHIFKHAEKFALPKIDQLVADTKTDTEMNKVADSLVKELAEVSPQLKLVATEHAQAISVLKSLLAQLEALAAPKRNMPISEQMRAGLTSDKKRLEAALKNDNLETVIKLTKKIIGEAEITRKDNLEKEAIAKIKECIGELSYMHKYKEMTSYLQSLAVKCQRLRLCGYVTGWKCDRKFLSRKMTLSEDGLTFGNSASNGYPAIIGDTPIDCGICAFEVIPTSLNCSGKEGFGIIELDRYLERQRSDPITPEVYSDMIGFFYPNTVRGMGALNQRSMVMGGKYVVRVDMANLTITIKGPETHMKGTLKDGVTYVPCFSCGCSSNRLTIKVLDAESDNDLS